MKTIPSLRHTISFKVFIALMLVLLLQAGFIYWQSSLKLEKTVMQEAVEDLRTLLISEQQVLEYLAARQDMEKIQQVITTLGVKTDIRRALLLDESEKIIAATRFEYRERFLEQVTGKKVYQKVQPQLKKAAEQHKGHVWLSADRNSLYAVIPITLGKLSQQSIRSDKVGFLLIDYNVERIRSRSFQLLFQTFVPELMVLFLSALMLAWYFHENISRRIKQLNQVARSFSNFDYSKRVAVSGHDEIAELSHTFNTMADDITQYHQQLVKREQDLSITLNSIGDAVIVTDKQGRVTRMNAVAEQLTGWRQQDALHLSVREVFPIVNASTREEIENPIEKVINSGEIVYLSNHTTLLSKDGNEYQIADSAAPIRNTSGGIEGMVLVFNDVTEQYRLREAVRQQQEEQKEILQTMIEGVITFDEYGRILNSNHSVEKIFAYDEDELKQCRVTDLIPDLDTEYLHQVVQGTLPLEKSEVIATAKNGDTFPLRLLVSELPDNGSGIKRFIASCHDLSQSKLQQEQVRRSQKMDALGKLTGGIAHDYNNMLGVILGYAELLSTMLQDQPDLLQYTNEIMRAGERGASLTKKLLGFSKRHAEETESVDLNAVLQDEKDMLQKTLTARIKLIFSLEVDIWPVKLDIAELEDVIVNLSINAMHAMEGQGELVIQTRNLHLDEHKASLLNISCGDYVTLEFTDNGCGMDEETREKIFEPFFTTKGEAGTGLGLTQVYGFVERCGGAIQVESQPGEGATIRLFFPRNDAIHNGLAGDSNEAVRSDLSGSEVILVVDDEAGLRKLTCNILEKHGYRVLSAASSAEALEILAAEAVDVLLTDIVMPEMDGVELARVVCEKYPQVKIQLVSGYTDDRSKHEGMDKLYKYLLNKPYRSEQLLKRLRDLLQT